MLKRWLSRTVFAVCVLLPTLAQAQLVNCPSGFNSNTSGNCSTNGTSAQFQLLNQTALSGTAIELMNSSGHQAFNFWTTAPANVQAFSTTFTFHDDCSVDPGACGFGWGFMG